ncbi:MAG: acylphosphatase [Sedimentisphaerales bacterium]|jgi:acylphosphatase
MDVIAKHIVYSGRVQGVGFRFTVLNVANNYRLTGYVRNLSSGSVETLVQGPVESIDSFQQDIEESFAGYLRQTDVDLVPPDTSLAEFKITF